jgi:hypothetical protein
VNAEEESHSAESQGLKDVCLILFFTRKSLRDKSFYFIIHFMECGVEEYLARFYSNLAYTRNWFIMKINYRLYRQLRISRWFKRWRDIFCIAFIGVIIMVYFCEESCLIMLIMLTNKLLFIVSLYYSPFDLQFLFYGRWIIFACSWEIIRLRDRRCGNYTIASSEARSPKGIIHSLGRTRKSKY